ncbi:MAG: 50S ribosomal protein L18 [Patescibacteria group bacterium]|mgnify:FL=1
MKRFKKVNIKKTLRKNRVRAKLFGTADRPRASIFRSNKFLYVQLIDDQKGHTLISAASKKGIKEALKLGEKIAELAKKTGIKNVLLDRGSYRYHGQIKTVADSLRDSGIKI